MASTTRELIAELLPHEGKVLGVKGIIMRARLGQYHDYFTEAVAPKMDLVHALRLVGLDALAERVIAGEFDDINDRYLPEVAS